MISRPTYFHYYYNVFKIKGIKGKFVVTSSLAALVALAAAVMSSRAASRRWQSSLNSVISFDFTASITCHKFHCVKFFCLLLSVFLFCVCCQGGCITPFFLLIMLKQKSEGICMYIPCSCAPGFCIQIPVCKAVFSGVAFPCVLLSNPMHPTPNAPPCFVVSDRKKTAKNHILEHA